MKLLSFDFFVIFKQPFYVLEYNNKQPLRLLNILSKSIYIKQNILYKFFIWQDLFKQLR